VIVMSLPSGVGRRDRLGRVDQEVDEHVAEPRLVASMVGGGAYCGSAGPVADLVARDADRAARARGEVQRGAPIGSARETNISPRTIRRMRSTPCSASGSGRIHGCRQQLEVGQITASGLLISWATRGERADRHHAVENTTRATSSLLSGMSLIGADDVARRAMVVERRPSRGLDHAVLAVGPHDAVLDVCSTPSGGARE